MMDDEGNIVLDFDSILPPEGEYVVNIAAVRLNRKKNATAEDFPYLEFHYGIMSRSDGGDMSEELIGHDIMDICSLNPTARWKLKGVLEAFTCKDWGEKQMTVNPNELLGLEAIAVIVHESYNGVQRAKASRVYNPDFMPIVKDDVPSEDVWSGFDNP